MARDLQIQLLALNALGMVGTSAAPILTSALKDQNVDVRRNACWILGELRAGSAVEALKDALDDYNASVRRVACWALGQIGDPAAVEALVECARDEDHRIRSAACAALGNIGDPAAVPALKAALADSNVNVRNAAEQALKNITNQVIVDITVECTKRQMHSVSVKVSNWGSWEVIDSTCMQTLGQASGRMALCYHRVMERSLEVRRSVVSALGRKGRSGVSALIGALADSEVRALACQMLGQINDKTAIPALIEQLEDASSDVRIAACTALGQIGDASAAPALIKRLEDADWSVRRAACTALGQIGDPAAVPTLRVHAEVMQEARQALVKLGRTSMALQEAVCTLAEQSQWGVLCRVLTSNQVRDAIEQLGSSAVPALIDALRDDDPRIRQAACTALGKIGDPSAVPALIACLDQRNISEVAANALVQIGKPAVPALIETLTNPNERVRKAACTALGQIGDPSAVPALITCLDYWYISQAAANALIQIGKPAIPALIETLTNPNERVRKAACTALGQIGDPSAVPALIACLDKRDISEAAANALIQIDKPAVPALIEALTSPSNRARSAACTALGKIGDKTAVPKLITCLKDRDSDVRSSACTALGKIGDLAAISALSVYAEIMQEARQALARLGGTSMSLQEAVSTLAEQSLWGVLCCALTSAQVLAAIVQLGSSAIPALMDALRDHDPNIRRAACIALGQIGDTAAVPALIQRLGDANWSVRNAACIALGQVGDTAAVPALRVHAEIMEEAREALAMLGGTSIALQEAVRTLAEQSLWGVLCRALTSDQVRAALVQLGSSAAPLLIDALRDDNPKIRCAACIALGQIGDPAAIPALRVHAEVMQEAREALAMLGGTSMALQDAVRTLAEQSLWGVLCRALISDQVRDIVVQLETDVASALIDALTDVDRELRIAACTALGQIRDSSAVPALISTLYDEDVDVRIAATDAIVNIGEAAIPALQEAITSGDPTIHKKVSGILNIIKQRTQR
jgi:HEAT repeat protein